MTFLTALYTLIIYPIELLFEIVFSIIFKASASAFSFANLFSSM